MALGAALNAETLRSGAERCVQHPALQFSVGSIGSSQQLVAPFLVYLSHASYEHDAHPGEQPWLNPAAAAVA